MAQEGGLHRGAGARTYSDIDDYYNIGAAKGLRLTSWNGADVKGIIEYDASGDLIFSTENQTSIMTIKDDGSGVVFGGTNPGFLVDFVRASSAANGLELRNFGESAVLTLGVANTLDATFAGALGIAGDFSVNTDKLTVNATTGALGIAGDVTLAADKKLALSASGTGLAKLLEIKNSAGTPGYFISNGGGFGPQIAGSAWIWNIVDDAGSVLFKVGNNGIITGPSTIPTDITTGAVNGLVIRNTGVLYHSKASTSKSTHQAYYNPNGLIASLQTNTINLDIAIAQTDGAFRITSGGNRMFQVNDNGIIIGTASTPTSILNGTEYGKVLDASGVMRSSYAASTIGSHFIMINSNGEICSLQTEAGRFIMRIGAGGDSIKMRSIAGTDIFSVQDSGIITGVSTIPTDITTGAVNGKVINNGGRIYSSIASTATSTHESFYNPNGTIASLQTSGADFIIDCTGSFFMQAGAYSVRVDQADGRLSPELDNTQSLGSASRRWSVVYAGTGTINTSDEDEKQMDVIDSTEWDKVLKVVGDYNVRSYKFLDAIDEKGESARIHFGVGAQSLISALEAEGLDPYKYAFICYDEWEEEREDVFETEIVTSAKEAVLDEEGNVIEEAVEEVTKEVKVGEKVTLEAGSRYGIRYDELYAVKLAALEQRLAALEAN